MRNRPELGTETLPPPRCRAYFSLHTFPSQQQRVKLSKESRLRLGEGVSKVHDLSRRTSPRPGFKSFITTCSFDGTTVVVLVEQSPRTDHPGSSSSFFHCRCFGGYLRGMIGTTGNYIPGIVEGTELFKNLRRPLGTRDATGTFVVLVTLRRCWRSSDLSRRHAFTQGSCI